MKFYSPDPPSHIPADWLDRKNAFLPVDAEEDEEDKDVIKPCTGTCCVETTQNP